MDRHSAGPIQELHTRPGGWHQVSGREHRTQFGGIGEVPLVVNFAREGQPPRYATIFFMLFEDDPLPRCSSTDFVLHSPFAAAFQIWLRDASHSDVALRSFQQSSQSLPRFVLPRVLPAESSSPLPGNNGGTPGETGLLFRVISNTLLHGPGRRIKGTPLGNMFSCDCCKHPGGPHTLKGAFAPDGPRPHQCHDPPLGGSPTLA